jgi:periodic tryptophan protein 2
LAAGNSKYVCLYHINQKLLLKKYQVSHNLSLQGVVDFLNSKNMTEAGPMDQIDDQDHFSDEERELQGRDYMPGAQSGDLSKRSTLPQIRVKSVCFSPNARAFSCCTPEGLLVYSLDDAIVFDPFELDLDVTPENIEKTLKEGQYLKALWMALRLNIEDVLEKTFYGIPADQIQIVAEHFPSGYLDK